MVKEKSDPIEVRLNAIIRLLSDSLIAKENATKTSIYTSLNEVGLGPTDIGKIFGKSRTDIGVLLPKKNNSKAKLKDENDE
ncbi:MAG: hypothetical protein GKS07_02285 [Nitrosopumilus sp.]|nr:MAG: hypothetical protein GKS07_02285 [Nitrosopumilus sp.]